MARGRHHHKADITIPVLILAGLSVIAILAFVFSSQTAKEGGVANKSTTPPSSVTTTNKPSTGSHSPSVVTSNPVPHKVTPPEHSKPNSSIDATKSTDNKASNTNNHGNNGQSQPGPIVALPNESVCF